MEASKSAVCKPPNRPFFLIWSHPKPMIVLERPFLASLVRLIFCHFDKLIVIFFSLYVAVHLIHCSFLCFKLKLVAHCGMDFFFHLIQFLTCCRSVLFGLNINSFCIHNRLLHRVKCKLERFD